MMVDKTANNLTETKKITPKQARALSILLTGGGAAEAATAAGVSRSSVYKWIEQPHFQRELTRMSDESFQRLSRLLVSLGSSAIRVIYNTMHDESLPSSVRLRAADIVLSRSLALRDQVDLETRINDLELAIENQADNSHHDYFGVRPVDYRTAIGPLAPREDQE